MLRRLGIPRREAVLLGAIVAVGFAVRLAFVLATSGHTLAGDEVEYDQEGRFIADGRWFWTYAPTGVPHEGAWKTPVYPIFVGLLYKLVGPEYDRVLLIQTLIGPVTIALTWLLARRLFGSRVALASAAVVAVSPFAWQFEVRLLAESIAAPLTLLFLIVLFGAVPTAPRAAGVGALAGLLILTRPSALYLLPAIAAAFLVCTGLRRGAFLTAVAVGVAALVITPWTIRNYVALGGFVPLSVQDITPYGSFNDDAANDPEAPYAWRTHNRRDAPILENARELGDLEFRDRLRSNVVEYVRENPSSIVKAFYWNGIRRLWDLRDPRTVIEESRYNGRSRTVTAIGLAVYWVLLPFAIAGLWLLRRRPAVLIPLLVLALSASLVFATSSGTRFRAPFEPVIAILACSAAVPAFARLRSSRARRRRSGPREPEAVELTT